MQQMNEGEDMGTLGRDIHKDDGQDMQQSINERGGDVTSREMKTNNAQELHDGSGLSMAIQSKPNRTKREKNKADRG